MEAEHGGEAQEKGQEKVITDQLTAEHVHLDDGTTAFLYRWKGETVAVRDDALTAIKIIELYRRQDMDDNEKGIAILELMFPNPSDAFCACDFVPGEFAALIKAIDLDVYGIDTTGRNTETPLWDLKQDAAIIRTSLRMAYGIDWDAARSALSWAELTALIGSLPYETPLGNRIYYRNPKNRPKRTKHNREQVAEFDRLHRMYKLTKTQKGSQDRIAASQHAMDDLALAVRKRKE